MNKKAILILNNEYLSKSLLRKLKRKFILIEKNIEKQKNFLKFLKKIKKKEIELFCIFSSLGFSYNFEILNLMKPSLKFFISPTTGLDHIDLSQLKKQNIKLMYLSQYPKFLNSITSTSEHTWSIIMALLRKILPANYDVIFKKKWNREKFQSNGIQNKNLCIVGFGRIGKHIAKYGKFFGMNIYVFDKKKKLRDKNIKFVKYLSLDNLIKKADVLTIHIPFNKKNKMFIKNSQLDMLKKESILVNTSRGNLFSESKALNLLKRNKISGLGLDVLDNDSSWNLNSKLKNTFKGYKDKNLIITPHIGGNSIEARHKTSNFLLEQFLKKI